MLEELARRDGLDIALSARDEGALEPLLRFVVRYVTSPNYAPVLLDVCHRLLQLYASVVGQSVVIDGLLLRLRQTLRQELKVQKRLFAMVGVLDTILAVSAQSAGSERKRRKVLSAAVTVTTDAEKKTGPADGNENGEAEEK